MLTLFSAFLETTLNGNIMQSSIKAREKKQAREKRCIIENFVMQIVRN